MIRVYHARYAPGLGALAVPGDRDVTVTVSSALEPGEQRAAMRTALKAARRAGWLPGPVPLFLLPLLAVRPAAKALALKAVATTAATAAVAGTVVALSAHPVTQPPAAQHSRPAVVQSGRHRQRRMRRGHPGRLQPGPVLVAAGSPPPRSHAPGQPQPQSSGRPQPVPTITTTAPAPSRSPSPAPSATPSPTPSPSPTGVCVILLGVKVCL